MQTASTPDSGQAVDDAMTPIARALDRFGLALPAVLALRSAEPLQFLTEQLSIMIEPFTAVSSEVRILAAALKNPGSLADRLETILRKDRPRP